MVDAVTLVTVGGVTLLFFFWVYGIYAFVRDLRRVLPQVRAAVREWRADDGEDDGPTEQETHLL
ncbi:hypothetical protein [Halosimplex marinum]|uniref:hypothetical protein n=1 Tax=Halosimplex marinum TaxID=3396620 RepID=UPI003F56A263